LQLLVGVRVSFTFDFLGEQMIKRPSPEEVCKEISAEVQDMARWLAGDDMSPEQFRLGLARLEERKLKRFGLKLSSSTSENGLVHFTLRFEENDEFCASMNVDPSTGSMTVQHSCSR